MKSFFLICCQLKSLYNTRVNLRLLRFYRCTQKLLQVLAVSQILLVYLAVQSVFIGEMSKYYGYVYVDKNDDGTGSLKRYRKKSFYWYRNVIASNGSELE